jgi:hypothetical protein
LDAARQDRHAARAIYHECAGCRDGVGFDKYGYKHDGELCLNNDLRWTPAFLATWQI